MMTNHQWRSLFRADRLATLYLSYPFRSVMRPRRGIPILMYHSVSDVSEGHRHPYFETVTTPRVFAEQMKFLKDHGYRTVTLDEAVRYVGSGMQDDQARVVITFDDGFQDFYLSAFPILEYYQFSATVFLPTSYIAEERRLFKKWPCMTWREVKEMHDSGILFGSHTVSHRQLHALKKSELQQEIRDSKKIIEDTLGQLLESFSCPFAFPQTDRAFKNILKSILIAEGYKNGVTTVIGTFRGDNDPFFLPRLPINSWDDLYLFRAKLKGAYDWLHYVQYAAKLSKSTVK